MEMQTKEALEYCKQSLMSDYGGNSENAGRNSYIKVKTLEVLDGNEDCATKCTRGCACYILTKNFILPISPDFVGE